MTWDHLDSSSVNGSVFDLYEQAGIYMVRVDGYELMNGNWHKSEDVLGDIAFQFARRADPHVLIGGLGLGYTLASLCRTMGSAGTIVVAEVSEAVIGWFDRFLQSQFFPRLPENVSIMHADVAEIVKSGRHFDVIALDVDNGPVALSQSVNSLLYIEQGLTELRKCLNGTGVLLVWSAFESGTFMDAGEAAGFHVGCKCITSATKDDLWHCVYVLSEQPFSEAELELIAQ